MKLFFKGEDSEFLNIADSTINGNTTFESYLIMAFKKIRNVELCIECKINIGSKNVENLLPKVKSIKGYLWSTLKVIQEDKKYIEEKRKLEIDDKKKLIDKMIEKGVLSTDVIGKYESGDNFLK